MATVVLDLFPAVAARLDRRTDIPKGLGLAFREVEQTVVRRVDPLRNRESKLDVHRDPVAEGQPPFHQVSAERDIPAGDVVEEKRAARLKNADTLGNPLVGPGQVILVRSLVIDGRTIFLAEIERRIREDRVNRLAPN